jgi:hypothetical protein
LKVVIFIQANTAFADNNRGLDVQGHFLAQFCWCQAISAVVKSYSGSCRTHRGDYAGSVPNHQEEIFGTYVGIARL